MGLPAMSEEDVRDSCGVLGRDVPLEGAFHIKLAFRQAAMRRGPGVFKTR